MKKFFLLVLVLIVEVNMYAQDNIDETETILTFSEQPNAISISPSGGELTIACQAEKDGCEITYQWYLSNGNNNTSGTAISGATYADYTTESFTEKGIRYYYCIATADDGTSATSDVAIVAYTGLPTLYVTTVDGEEPTAEYTYPPSGAYGRGITNATKVPSSMIILNAEGETIYESGEYVKKESGLTIKLRGNTSASLTGKSPYKLKLQKKTDLLANLLPRTGKEYKDKDWILLKDGVSLNTFVGMAVCDIAGVPWTPEFAYVNVVLNNDYRGCYMLIEAINQSTTRCDVSDDGYIIERDAYWWNEDVKFITTRYNQKYTFKYPDDDDITSEQLAYIEDYMNELEEHVADGTYEDYIDVESFARWLLIHDFLGTWDSGGSNAYMTKYDNTDATKIYMSTNWDYDSNYRMSNAFSNQHNGNRIYAVPMFKSVNRAFADKYKELYDQIAPTLWSQLSEKLNGLKENLGKEINLSRKLDGIRWNATYGTVESNINTASAWFRSRETWLDNALSTPHAITYELDGGEFEADVTIPESIEYNDRLVTIPQPKKAGSTFTGWTYGSVTTPTKSVTLYGYNTTNDITMTANWQTEVVVGIAENFVHGIKVWSHEKTIYIVAATGTDYQIYDISGRLLVSGTTNSDYDAVSLGTSFNGLVIVRIGTESFKIKY